MQRVAAAQRGAKALPHHSTTHLAIARCAAPWFGRLHGNDPSAGSPTETLLRLLLPLDAEIWKISGPQHQLPGSQQPLQTPHLNTQSVGATGGVYKIQGRIQCALMTRAYKEFLVQDPKLQTSIPITNQFTRLPMPFGKGHKCTKRTRAHSLSAPL